MTPLRTCHNTVGFVPRLWSTGEARRSRRARDPWRAGEPLPLTLFHLSFHASVLCRCWLTHRLSLLFFLTLTGRARAAWRDRFPRAWGTPRCRCKDASCRLINVHQITVLLFSRWKQGLEWDNDLILSQRDHQTQFKDNIVRICMLAFACLVADYIPPHNYHQRWLL